jgi:hypothetical protein
MLLAALACFSNNTGLGTVEQPTEGLTGNPIIEIDPTELFITDCEVGLAKSGTFTISSVGTDNLVIYTIERFGDDEIFYFEDQEDLEFAPGGGDSYPIAATLKELVPVDGEIRIVTNDVDNRDVRIPVHAWPIGYVPPEDSGDSGP